MVQSKRSSKPTRSTAEPHLLHRWGPLAIGLAAFVLRLLYLADARKSVLFYELGLDARFYDLWAKQVAGGDWVGVGPFFMGPLYPYFLGILYGLFGSNLDLAAYVQAGIDALTCGLIYVVARRIWAGEWAGLIAGLLACFYGPMMLYTSELLYPTLAMLIHTVFLYLVLRSEEREGTRYLFAAGIVLGVAALGKATALVFYPVVVLWWLLRQPRPRLHALVRPAAVLLVGVALVVLPVTARNRIVGDDWVLITSNGGLNFYIGNHAEATGAYVRPAGLDVNVDPMGQQIAEAASGRRLKPSEVSKYWFSRARDYLNGRPERFLGSFVKKMVFFWSALEIPQIENLSFQKRFSALLRLPFPTFGWVVPLAAVGVLLGGRRRRWAALPMGLAVVYSLAVAVFFVTGRYRMAVVPYLLILAGGGILCMADGVRDVRKGIVGIALCGVLLGMAHWNPYGVSTRSGFAEFEYRIGLNYDKQARLSEAESHYRRALDLEPFHPNSRLNLGVILAHTNRMEEARSVLEPMVERYPEHAKVQYNYGLVLADQGEYASAREFMRRAVSLDPEYMKAWHGYGVECYREGDLEEAENALRRSVHLAEGGDFGSWIRRGRVLLAKIEQRIEPRRDQSAAGRMLREADILVMDGHPDRAFAMYLEAGREGRIAEAYFEAGVVAYEEERLDDALAAFEECIALDPSFPGAHLMMGAIFAKRKDYEAALRANEAEAEVNPSSGEAHFKLGLLYENYVGDAQAALQAYEACVRLGGPRASLAVERIRKIRSDE